MKRITVFSASFFLVGFICNLYLGNVSELTLNSLYLPLILGFVLGLFLTFFSYLIYRKKSKAVIFSSILIVSAFVLGNWPIAGLSAIIVGGIVLHFTNAKWTTMISKYIFFIGLTLCIIALARIVIVEIARGQSGKHESGLGIKSTNARFFEKPDIYYIIPDSYSGSKNLLKYYGFDNSDFENFLKKKGFYIATNSTSNYPKTFLSLASSLNMEYLDFLPKNSSDLTLADPLMEDNNTVKFLKSLGYKYYHLGSWWGATHVNRNADQNIVLENENALSISEFDSILLSSTILRPVLNPILPRVSVGDSDVDRMNRADYQFLKLGEIAKNAGPKFVFAHIIAPHEPYFWDRNCNYMNEEALSRIEESVKYTNHLNCVNKKLEKSVDEILKNSKKPPVIIIQSDEGAPFLGEELTPWESWGKASDELLSEKFPVINAYFFPDNNYDELYDSITPVNSFRIVFNKYLGTKFSRLPDTNYVFTDLGHLYNFTDVTKKI